MFNNKITQMCVGSYSHIAFTVIETLEFYVQELRKRVRPL